MKRTLIITMVLAAFAAPARADTNPEIKPTVVNFVLVPSGHFIVKVKLNGKGPYNLIFDTGAPSTLISPRIAEDAKLMNKAKDKPLIPLFGMAGTVKVKEFQVGDVSANDVPAQIMDHPTVKLFSEEYGKKYGAIEGIVGFPFFAQYKMTVDYSTKQLTFVPNGYKAEDVMAALMRTVSTSMSSKPEPRIMAPAGLWGMEVAKKSGDEEAGVDLKAVASPGAAAEAGLKAGDRLLTLDGRWTDSVADVYAAASFVKPGTKVIAVVKRDGKEIKLTVSPRKGL